MRGVKFIKEREAAVRLRKRGFSIVEIEKKMKINRSTLSGWFKDIQLSNKSRLRLEQHRDEGLLRARKKAVQWHNEQKQKRFMVAESEANAVVQKLNFGDPNILELALAMLYWGEGYKKSVETGLGNSDPMVLKIFLHILRQNYHIDMGKIRAELYLRADQNPEEVKKYWSKELSLPMSSFRYYSLDKRTKGSKTFSGYHGVCSLRCSNVAIQRKLVSISRQFCEKVLRA